MNMPTLIAMRNMLIRSQCISSWVRGRFRSRLSVIFASAVRLGDLASLFGRYGTAAWDSGGSVAAGKLFG